jgi:site-specific recombinase XerD
MTGAPWKTPADMPAGWRPYWDSFCRSFLVTGDLATLDNVYAHSVARLGAFAVHRGRSTPLEVQREDVAEWIRELRSVWKPATVNTRYRNVRRFFNWLVEEGELDVSPVRRVPEPAVDEQPPQVLTEAQLRAILKACEGRDFYARRDTAIIRVLLDCGGRRTGVASMLMEDLDLNAGTAVLDQKGGGRYRVSLGVKAVRDLDRYLRARAQHPQARSPKVWIGWRGDMTGSGIYQIVRARAKEAGIESRVFAHLFRHTFGHLMKAAGLSDEDVMLQGGWRDARSLRRYGKSAAIERAHLAHKRVSPGDRI